MASITSVRPSNGRPGDVIRIAGTGFSEDTSILAVTIGGKASPILSASPRLVEALVPAGIAEDLQALVTVRRTDDPELAPGLFYWFVRRPRTALDTARLPAQLPAVLEDPAVEDPFRPEAKDIERLAARAESLLRESLRGQGGAGIVGSDPGALGGLGSPATVAAALASAAGLALGLAGPGAAARTRPSGTPAQGGGFPRPEATLATVPIPAGRLGVGSVITVEAAGSIGEEPAGTRELAFRVKLGPTVVAQLQQTFPGRLGARLEATILVTGEAQQQASGIGRAGGREDGPTIGAPGEATVSSPAEDTTGLVLLTVTGQEVSGSGGPRENLVLLTRLSVSVHQRGFQALARRPQDDAGTTDSVATDIRVLRRFPQDAAAAQDSLDAKLTSRAAGDAVEALEALLVTAGPEAQAHASDGARAADSALRGLDAPRSAADAADAADTVTPEPGPSPADSAAAADSVGAVLDLARRTIDSVVSSDAASTGSSLGSGASDSASATDSATGVLL